MIWIDLDQNEILNVTKCLGRRELFGLIIKIDSMSQS
jgi:hypothetical protein